MFKFEKSIAVLHGFSAFYRCHPALLGKYLHAIRNTPSRRCSRPFRPRAYWKRYFQHAGLPDQVPVTRKTCIWLLRWFGTPLTIAPFDPLLPAFWK